ncbi:MAG: hypothetical protein MUC28_03750 [Planctomycetes bacterium]|jgi:hypothetical protein|nr:hypothetical protein [Planctomycetota bacterium]
MKKKDKKGKSADEIRLMLENIRGRGTDKEWRRLGEIKKMIITSEALTISEIQELGDLFMKLKIDSARSRIG